MFLFLHLTGSCSVWLGKLVVPFMYLTIVFYVKLESEQLTAKNLPISGITVAQESADKTCVC